MVSTNEIKKKYGLCVQYSIYEPWLKENGFNIENLPLAAKTEDGEDVIIENGGFDDDGNIIWRISTFQTNGWTAIREYYKDGTITETFERY